MASLDTFRDFIKNRLAAYDPSIDISDGSTADTEVVEPIVARLGTQPFDLDTKTFIKQRISESYPNNYTEGEIEDLFINPLLTIIDPLVQEEERIAKGQSLNNLSLLADEEVDDLVANSFVTRDTGGYASGFIRCLYTTPVSLIITTDKAAVTKTGLNFFSPENLETSSAEMLLNRDGLYYYMDIFVVAENTGEQYNVDPDQFASFEDMKNPVKVTNLFKFTGGIATETSTQLIQRAKDGRIEQSLNTKRGATARTEELFPSIKAMQTIGAGEIGMNRDILDGSSDGPCYMTFLGGLFGTWIYIDTNMRFLDVAQTIEAGDKIKFQVATGGTVFEAQVVSVLFTSSASPPKYFIEVDTDFSTPPLYGHTIAGLLFKPGYITISQVPEGMLSGTIPTNQVHIGGFMDVYVAPTDDVTTEVIVKNVSDENAFFKTLTGAVTINDNSFITSPTTDFASLGIFVGDSLIIETGSSAGVYTIIYVDSTMLRVDSIFSSSSSGLRARVVKSLTMDYLAPKTSKVPFLTPVSDLSVTIGSTLFQTVTNLIGLGVVVGDTIEILSGTNKGTYVITAFDTGLGGNGPIVDRPAVFTQSGVSYKVYSVQTGLEVPIVRVQKIDILDSSNQPTGFTVPYGDFVDIRAKCNFDTPDPPEVVLDKKLFFIPDFSFLGSITPDPATPGANVDARYTQDIAPHDGVIRKITCSGANPITTVEINLPPFLYDGKKNAVMALVSKADPAFTSDPSNHPQTSPLAESEALESIISILNGTNIANYLIKDLRVLDLWGVSNAGHYKIAIAQIDGEFKTDPGNNILAVIAGAFLAGAPITMPTVTDYMKIFQYATDWTNASGFIEAVLIPKFQSAMSFYGFTLSTQDCRDFITSVVMTSYSVGEAPRGILRCYTKEPVTVELYNEPTVTSDNAIASVTTFTKLVPGKIPPDKKVRIVPNPGNGSIFPQSNEELSLDQYSRLGSMRYPADTYFYLTQPPSFLKRGVREGDVLEYYPAINDYSSRGEQNSSFLCVTTAGSDIVQLIWPSTRNNQTPLTTGQILCIDTGPDAGTYQILEVITEADPVYKVRISRGLTWSTLPYPSSIVFTGQTIGNSNSISDSSVPVIVSAGKYITVYAATDSSILTAGNDDPYLGTFAVTSYGLTFAVLDRTAWFPNTVNILWICHDPPTTNPAQTSGGGTELSTQYVRARLYSNTKVKQQISIDWTATPNPLDSSSTQQIQLPLSITTNGSTTDFSHKMPFRIVRDGVKVISSTEISKNREQGLYYFDISVLSLGTAKDYIFNQGDPFYISDSYKIEGYRLYPDNKILTYSIKESGKIKFPLGVLPVGATYSKDNYLSVAASNVKITYDQSPTVQNVQQFFSSPQDRVANTNTLVRHFLPAYPYIEISYVGGDDTSTVAAAIISYINTLIEDDNEIRVDDLVELVKKKLAQQVKNPIELVALVHGEDRSIRTLRSEDSIGFLSDPIYDGQQKMIIFYAGQDVSDLAQIPDLEYVKLMRS